MRHIYIVFSFDQKVRAVYIDEDNAISLYKEHEADGWYYEEHVLADWDRSKHEDGRQSEAGK